MLLVMLPEVATMYVVPVRCTVAKPVVLIVARLVIEELKCDLGGELLGENCGRI